MFFHTIIMCLFDLLNECAWNMGKLLNWELQIRYQLNVWIINGTQQTANSESVHESEWKYFFERNMIYTWSSITNIKFVYPVEYVQCSLLCRECIEWVPSAQIFGIRVRTCAVLDVQVIKGCAWCMVQTSIGFR